MPLVPQPNLGGMNPQTKALTSGNVGVNNYGGGDSDNAFSVMTWNVLADIYATIEAFPYSEPFVLAWNYRRDRILAEIVSYNPDIICLQVKVKSMSLSRTHSHTLFFRKFKRIILKISSLRLY